MSNSEEIFAVYSDEIDKKSYIVEQRFGKGPFYENFNSFCFFSEYGGLGIEDIVCSDFKPKKRGI